MKKYVIKIKNKITGLFYFGEKHEDKEKLEQLAKYRNETFCLTENEVIELK